MSDFKKKHQDKQNNMGNKPREFQEPHGTPMAPEGEKQHKNMSNQGGQSKQNMGNKSFEKPNYKKDDCDKGSCSCDCKNKNNCHCNCK